MSTTLNRGSDACLIVHGYAAKTKRGRVYIATWLRERADALEKDWESGAFSSGARVARYLYPDESAAVWEADGVGVDDDD